MKDLGIIHLEVEGTGVLGFDTGLNVQAFAQAKMAQFITQQGYIVTPRGTVEPWKPGGVIEREGTMVIWGPDFDGEGLDKLVCDTTKKETALDAVRFWIKGRLLLENQKSPPFPWPAGTLVAASGDGTILFPPERILRRILEAAGDDAWLAGAASWVHPDLTGGEAAAYAAATMLYRIFCGTGAFQNPDIDVVRQDMREGVFVPVRLLAPGLDKNLARLLDETLAPVKYFSQKGTKRPSLESFAEILGPPGSRESISYIRELAREEQAKLNQELEQFQKKKDLTVKTKRFLVRNTAIITGVLIALVVLVLSVRSILSGRANMPNTRGMNPREVVETYYGAFGTLDHTLMEACVTNKAGKNDIAMISNLFVMSRVRMAYEMNNPVISAQEWLDAGGLPTDQTVVGITGMDLTELDTDPGDGEVSFRVSYTLWLPGASSETPEATEPASGDFKTLPQSVFYRDELRLVLRKDLWLIGEIRRETPADSG
ncbi:DUF1366 domain-containing protein [Treponema sp. TIM-1]|uniref:hypothetical protein n=1 Tax=Treponema sp. TIM-1 TaxID=2898417 RepID=UPI003980787B